MIYFFIIFCFCITVKNPSMSRTTPTTSNQQYMSVI